MKSFRVSLPYWCVRDAILDYVVEIRNCPNEIEAIRRAAVSFAESDRGCGGPPEDKFYISVWQRAQAGEEFGYEDLVPQVEEVK